MRQCEAATTRGRRCRRGGLEYCRVRLGDVICEVLLYQQHREQVHQGRFRHADGQRQEVAA